MNNQVLQVSDQKNRAAAAIGLSLSILSGATLPGCSTTQSTEPQPEDQPLRWSAPPPGCTTGCGTQPVQPYQPAVPAPEPQIVYVDRPVDRVVRESNFNGSFSIPQETRELTSMLSVSGPLTWTFKVVGPNGEIFTDSWVQVVHEEGKPVVTTIQTGGSIYHDQSSKEKPAGE